MARPALRNKLTFEPLEDRAMMAGNVVVKVINDTLFIAGDKADNQVSIQRVCQTGEYLIQGSGRDGDVTRINGTTSPFLLPAIPQNVRISLGDGNDSLTMISGGEIQLPMVPVFPICVHPAADVQSLPDAFFVAMGSGDDRISLHNWEIDGGLILQSGPGADRLSFFELTVNGRLVVNTGTEADRMTMDCVACETAFINMSTGDDNLVIEELLAVDYLLVNSGADDDEISIARCNFQIPMDCILNAYLPPVEFGVRTRNLVVSSGSGNDSVGIARSTITDSLCVSLGGGDDRVKVYSEGCRKVMVNGGEGYDESWHNLFDSNKGAHTRPVGLEVMYSGQWTRQLDGQWVRTGPRWVFRDGHWIQEGAYSKATIGGP